jgi:endonuclease-3
VPEHQSKKLRRCASIMLHELNGDLGPERLGDLRAAMKVLRTFPAIGEPGAEKILLFSRLHSLPALDSNGLRVLLRLGYGEETGNYAQDYRAAQRAIRAEIREDRDWLIAMHQLLRRHGQELCRRREPLCGACPLRDGCRYAAARAPG